METKSTQFLYASLTFLLSLLAASIWSAVAAQFFSGNWHFIKWYDDLPDAIIFATTVTLLVYVIRNAVPNHRRGLLIFGLSLLALERLIQIPLQEYGEAIAPAGDIFWIYAYGVGFTGLILIFLGVTSTDRSDARFPYVRAGAIFLVVSTVYWIVTTSFLSAGEYGYALPTMMILFSILLFWKITLFVRRQGSMTNVWPFFYIAILLNILGSFLYYGLFYSFAWFSIELAFLICLFWIARIVIAQCKTKI